MNLNQQTVRELQFFVGKVCTVMVPHNAGISIDSKRFIDFFVGRVDAVNEHCVWISHLITGQKSAIFEVVSINEEQVISTDHPDYEKLKQESEKLTKTPLGPKPQSVSIDSLTHQAQQVKEKVGKI